MTIETHTCMKCGQTHTFRWIEPPGAWMAECPRLDYRVEVFPGGRRVMRKGEFDAKLFPDGKARIVMARGMTVACFTIDGPVVGYHEG